MHYSARRSFNEALRPCAGCIGWVWRESFGGGPQAGKQKSKQGVFEAPFKGVNDVKGKFSWASGILAFCWSRLKEPLPEGICSWVSKSEIWRR